MIQIKDQYDPELREIIKKKKNAAIIPIGSIEQHGPHLPVSTDSDIVTEIAKKVAQKTGFLLTPTINFGVSFEHAPFFNLSIKNSTLQKMITDICNSLSKNGVNTIFVLNGHHGNQTALKKFENNPSLYSKKIKVFVISYWHFMKSEFDHAGHVETSLMLEISKNVKMRKARIGLITENLSKKEKNRLNKLASKSFPKATKNGIWGNPTNATKKDGKALLDEIVKNLTKRCQTCLTGQTRKLHQ